MRPNEEEQSIAKMRDVIPRMWFNLYQGSLQAGFTPPVALDLLKTFILGSGGARIMPPNSGDEIKPDTPTE